MDTYPLYENIKQERLYVVAIGEGFNSNCLHLHFTNLTTNSLHVAVPCGSIWKCDDATQPLITRDSYNTQLKPQEKEEVEMYAYCGDVKKSVPNGGTFLLQKQIFPEVKALCSQSSVWSVTNGTGNSSTGSVTTTESQLGLLTALHKMKTERTGLWHPEFDTSLTNCHAGWGNHEIDWEKVERERLEKKRKQREWEENRRQREEEARYLESLEQYERTLRLEMETPEEKQARKEQEEQERKKAEEQQQKWEEAARIAEEQHQAEVKKRLIEAERIRIAEEKERAIRQEEEQKIKDENRKLFMAKLQRFSSNSDDTTPSTKPPTTNQPKISTQLVRENSIPSTSRGDSIRQEEEQKIKDENRKLFMAKLQRFSSNSDNTTPSTKPPTTSQPKISTQLVRENNIPSTSRGDSKCMAVPCKCSSFEPDKFSAITCRGCRHYESQHSKQ